MMCTPCFDNLVLRVSTHPDRLQRGNQLPCPVRHCDQTYTPDTVFSNATSATISAFHQLTVALERAAIACTATTTAGAGDTTTAAVQSRPERGHPEATQALPLGWTLADGTPWTQYTPHKVSGPELVEVAADSDEFKKCQRRFRHEGLCLPLKRVERVQNPVLWTKYRKSVEAIELVAFDSNEMWLFHATGSTSPMQIAQHTGIDFRYSNDGLFGRGAYFAERSDYSNKPQYVHKNSHGERQMFLARVTAGRVQALGKDQRDGTILHPAQGYDSIRGHVLDPDYYAVIIYDVSQSYPAYLLTY